MLATRLRFHGKASQLCSHPPTFFRRSNSPRNRSLPRRRLRIYLIGGECFPSLVRPSLALNYSNASRTAIPFPCAPVWSVLFKALMNMFARATVFTKLLQSRPSSASTPLISALNNRLGPTVLLKASSFSVSCVVLQRNSYQPVAWLGGDPVSGGCRSGGKSSGVFIALVLHSARERSRPAFYPSNFLPEHSRREVEV